MKIIRHYGGAALMVLLMSFTSVFLVSCPSPVGFRDYTVTYNSNSGTGTSPLDSNRYQIGAAVTVLGQGSLTKTDHTFAGWNTASNGLGTDRAAGSTFTMGSEDVMLYAMWTQNPTYTVTYNANTGSGTELTDGNNYQVGDTVTVLGQGSLTKTDHTFAGWNTQANGLGTDRPMSQDSCHTLFQGDDNHGLLGETKDAGSSEGAATFKQASA